MADNKYKVVALDVQAFQFVLGMEDKVVSRSVNTRGRPVVVTPNGEQVVFEGSEDTPADWIIIYPDGTKEVVSDKLFSVRYKLPRKRRAKKK